MVGPFDEMRASLAERGLRVVSEDRQRPWGGFLVIDDACAPAFVAEHFPESFTQQKLDAGGISPKVLFVAPGQRMSWQYHHRRAELWRAISGTVLVASSPNDVEPELVAYPEGTLIDHPCGQRHRAGAPAEAWAIIAEVWIHIDQSAPSDEDDIVRLADDYAR